MEQKFQTMDLSSNSPTTVKMEVIDVEISTGDILTDYAKAFVNECGRVNPLKQSQVELTSDEMVRYANFLLMKRLEIVNMECRDFKKLKSLYIPAYLQYVLSMVGIVIDRSKGLTFKPFINSPEPDSEVKSEESTIELDSTTTETTEVKTKKMKSKSKVLTLDEAYQISDKIGSFESDLQIAKNAMPKDIEGNPDLMQTAIIAGYLRSITKLDHPAPTYVAAFLNLKLLKEAAFQVLYRIQYDDLDFIRVALTTQKELFV